MDQQSCPSSGVDDDTPIHHFFSKRVQSQIEQHPCYSQQAHQYARLHLPVAPACNIQCNYCNRKYDCSNESRPGVVSQLVDPAAALKQFQALKKRAPNLTVVGIAGPGDALANPQATFATLRAIRRVSPETQLCLSTNGLMLIPYIDELIDVGVHHLTITINCTDPQIGAQIYPWIYFNQQRLRGVAAAQTLIDHQLAGLTAAAASGMLVKVNTVLIPGINDHHIEAVSVAVKHHGALLHNIMPLISDPAHGTYFGLTGQRGPDPAEIADARRRSGVHMPQMTHCQQCRADAAGTLGGCSTPDTPAKADPQSARAYRIAVASDSSGYIKVHFGHTRSFEIYDYSPTQSRFNFTETRYVEQQYCQGTEACETSEEQTQESDKNIIIETISDCDMVLCARIGILPWRLLEKQHVLPNVDHAFQSVEQVLSTLAAQRQSTTAVTLSPEHLSPEHLRPEHRRPEPFSPEELSLDDLSPEVSQPKSVFI